MFMVTLPDPRQDNYEANDYAVIKSNVLGYMNEIVNDIGLYPMTVTCDLL